MTSRSGDDPGARGETAIAKNRELMGAIDLKKAEAGTIRTDFADSIDANAVHGSDGPDIASISSGGTTFSAP